MKEDPPLDTRCRDKFLVQSVAILVGQVSGDENVVSSEVAKLMGNRLNDTSSGQILIR